jgi:hypothetical protein
MGIKERSGGPLNSVHVGVPRASTHDGAPARGCVGRRAPSMRSLTVVVHRSALPHHHASNVATVRRSSSSSIANGQQRTPARGAAGATHATTTFRRSSLLSLASRHACARACGFCLTACVQPCHDVTTIVLPVATLLPAGIVFVRTNEFGRLASYNLLHPWLGARWRLRLPLQRYAMSAAAVGASLFTMTLPSRLADTAAQAQDAAVQRSGHEAALRQRACHPAPATRPAPGTAPAAAAARTAGRCRTCAGTPASLCVRARRGRSPSPPGLCVPRGGGALPPAPSADAARAQAAFPASFAGEHAALDAALVPRLAPSADDKLVMPGVPAFPAAARGRSRGRVPREQCCLAAGCASPDAQRALRLGATRSTVRPARFCSSRARAAA